MKNAVMQCLVVLRKRPYSDENSRLIVELEKMPYTEEWDRLPEILDDYKDELDTELYCALRAICGIAEVH